MGGELLPTLLVCFASRAGLSFGSDSSLLAAQTHPILLHWAWWGQTQLRDMFSIKMCCFGNAIGLVACYEELYRRLLVEGCNWPKKLKQAFFVPWLTYILTKHHSNRINDHIPASAIIEAKVQKKEKVTLFTFNCTTALCNPPPTIQSVLLSYSSSSFWWISELPDYSNKVCILYVRVFWMALYIQI